MKKLFKVYCSNCNRNFLLHQCFIKKSKNNFCCKECYYNYQRTHKEMHTRISSLASSSAKKRWKNHIHKYKANSYIMTKPKHNHPYKNKRGYVYVHRLVMEKKLARFLTPSEVVHHKDGNKLNNNISNLVMFRSTNEHTTYHLFNGDVGTKNSRGKKYAKQLLQSQYL